MIDAGGNPQDDVRLSYLNTSTPEDHRPDDLRRAEGLLLEAGMLSLIGSRLSMSPKLRQFVGLDEADAVDLLRVLLATDSIDKNQLGESGEEYVAGVLRNELEGLGYPNLAARVQRVSVLSDGLGYDVYAPTLSPAAARHLEVKTQGRTTDATARFFLSRNEFEVGKSSPSEWALVVCMKNDRSGELRISGWCRALTLQPYLPEHRNGRWTESVVTIPVSILIEGFPPAV